MAEEPQQHPHSPGEDSGHHPTHSENCTPDQSLEGLATFIFNTDAQDTQEGVTGEAHPALAEFRKPIPPAQVSVGRGQGLAGLSGSLRSRALRGASVLHQEPAGQGSNRQLENKVNPIGISNTTTGKQFKQLILRQAECSSIPKGSHTPRAT